MLDEAAWRSVPLLSAAYLDLCTGSAATILQHVDFIESKMKSDGDRIVAWTLCSRSFEGEPFLSRTMRLICGMYKRNWKPASSDLEKSQNYYRNGS